MAASTRAVLSSITLCLLYGVAGVASACPNMTKLSTQLDASLALYDRELPPTPPTPPVVPTPPAPPAPPVLVALTLDVRHASLQEQAGTMRILADLRMSWLDGRLVWNATAWGCDFALAAAERLWTPDVTLVNAAATSSVDHSIPARITDSGILKIGMMFLHEVTWTTRLDVSIPVTMDLQDWPSDVQVGEFKFASRAHSVDEIELTVKEFATVYESGAWEILSLSGETSLLGARAQAGGEGPRRAGSWRVSVRRRAPAQAVCARAALAAALALLVSAALLPPAARAPLAAAAALILALWLCGAAWRLQGARSAPRCVRLGGAVCGAAGAYAAAAALLARVARLSAPPPRALKSVVSAATRVFALSPEPAGGGVSGVGGAWAAGARLLDATLHAALALLLLVLLCIYL